MSEAAQLLWRVNNEYRLRLTKAINSLDLLMQLLQARGEAALEESLNWLLSTRAYLATLAEEHRDWRYRYFYSSPQERRMVQDEPAVYRALSGFSRMQAHHQRVLGQVWDLLRGLPRPDTRVTAVATADLWERAERAVCDLASFDHFMETVRQ
jgi:hypothetical protein